MPVGRARSCLCRLRRHIRRAAISTSRANPTAPMPMPALAPVLRLRLLESLATPGIFAILVADGVAVGVESDAVTDLVADVAADAVARL